jgi:hypothetical protein
LLVSGSGGKLSANFSFGFVILSANQRLFAPRTLFRCQFEISLCSGLHVRILSRSLLLALPLSNSCAVFCVLTSSVFYF